MSSVSMMLDALRSDPCISLEVRSSLESAILDGTIPSDEKTRREVAEYLRAEAYAAAYAQGLEEGRREVLLRLAEVVAPDRVSELEEVESFEELLARVTALMR